MNITIKQLLDIVSLSIEAVHSKADPTVLSHTETFFYDGNSTALITAVENEVSNILDDSPETIEVAKTLNSHLGAIRLGMKLNQQSKDF